LTDTVDKAARMRSSLDPADAARGRKVAAAAFDTLLWQALASVAVPGLTINRLCALSLWSLARLAPAVPLVTRKWMTTAVGLGAIPFIVHPIDSMVHFAMDKTTRSENELPQCLLSNKS
jgi:fission process protein 1